MTVAAEKTERKTLPVENPKDFIENRVFVSEIKRLDSEVSNIKKSVEKQEDKFTRALGGVDMN